MAAGGSTQQSFRKALGALKDSTKVGLVKVNSDHKQLDVAIVKATNHFEVIPKEKHIRTICDAVSLSRPRTDIAYCIHSLAKRLTKTHNWAVALKILVVIHRAFREVDTAIHVEIVNYSHSRGHMLNLSHFKDDSSPNAWEYSAWVRCYALYLEERLECYQMLKYDVERDHLKTKELSIPDLLDQLPVLQQLLFRLLACQPEGMARSNILIQYALSLVASESTKIYIAITDGTVNLVDKFFEMQRRDSVRALEIYGKLGDQAERLSEFFEICRGLEFGREQKYVKIEQPPASFMSAMEEYVKEAPQTLALPKKVTKDGIGATPKAIPAPKPDLETDCTKNIDDEEKSEPSITTPKLRKNDHSEAVAMSDIIDLLDLDDLTHGESELGNKTPFFLAMSTPENPTNSSRTTDLTTQSTNWELELVTSASSSGAALAESKLGGGLDLTLDSLYDNALTNQNGNKQTREARSNPFEDDDDDVHYTQDSLTAPSENQQEAFIMQQQPMEGHNTTNPFGNPFI